MRRLTCIFVTAFISVAAMAQNEAFPFIRVVQDPVLQGMAGAGYVSDYGTASAAFGTSAISALSDRRLNVQGAYQNFAGTNYYSVAGGGRILPFLSICGAASFGTGKSYETVDATGNPGGTFTPYDIVGGLGVSFRIQKWLSAGFNLRYASQTIAKDANYSAFGGDVYAACRFGGLRAAIGAVGLGTGVKSASGNVSPLPSSIKLGLGYSIDILGNHIEANADGDWFFKSGLAASIGAAYSFKDFISVRCGYHYGGNTVIPSYASVGLGTSFKGIKIDAAYLFGQEELQNCFCVGAGFRF